MSNLEPLIADFALILVFAGVMTLLFKALKQPIVLGYIVALIQCAPFLWMLIPEGADNLEIDKLWKCGAVWPRTSLRISQHVRIV